MNPEEKTAVIFPAFVTEFIGIETDGLQKLGADFSSYLQRASCVCGNDIARFDIRDSVWIQDELMIQYITYVYSCAVSDILKKHHLEGDFVSGYSMGIYAALYHTGGWGFEDGLKAIQHAFRAIQQTLGNDKYTMGLTGGLELQDVKEIMNKVARNTYIINSNNPHTFVYSGPASEVSGLIAAAKEEGALMTRIMNVTVPYHSPYLEKASSLFAEVLSDLTFAHPQINLISSIDQRALMEPGEIRRELVNNLFHPFRWYETIRFFLQHQTSLIIECGAGEGLSKINKFISGDYRTVNLKSLSRGLYHTA